MQAKIPRRQSYILTCNAHWSANLKVLLLLVRIALYAIDGPLTRYAKLWVAHVPGMPGMFSPPPRVSDPDMHHGTCATHVPWCMPGSLTNGFLWSRRRGKMFPAFPMHAQPTTFAYLERGPYLRGFDLMIGLIPFNPCRYHSWWVVHPGVTSLHKWWLASPALTNRNSSQWIQG